MSFNFWLFFLAHEETWALLPQLISPDGIILGKLLATLHADPPLLYLEIFNWINLSKIPNCYSVIKLSSLVLSLLPRKYVIIYLSATGRRLRNSSCILCSLA